MAAIAAEGGRAVALHADLGDALAPEQLVAEVERELGSIDVLVANAGLAQHASWEDVARAASTRCWRSTCERHSFWLAECYPGCGTLVWPDPAQLVGRRADRRHRRPHYAASKAGLHGITHHLAARVAGDGVTVNAIAPALIENTGMLPGDPSQLAKAIPIGRPGTPEEVADLALAVLRNGYVTSKVIAIDGGFHPASRRSMALHSIRRCMTEVSSRAWRELGVLIEHARAARGSLLPRACL